jgi:cobalt ECF transporter T component CbiQ
VHHDYLDRWSRLRSPVHRAPASLKLALALLAVATSVGTPVSIPAVFGALAALLVAAAACSRIPPRFLLRRLLLLEPLALGVVLLAALEPGGGVRAAWTLLRVTLCLATMILLTSTTPFAELVGVLRRLRVPALLLTVLALMYRYLFVLVDEAERMQRARRSRTFGAGRRRAWRVQAALVGQLFVRTSERAERIYAAMIARGFR